MSDPSDTLELVLQLFRPDQQAIAKTRGVLLSADGQRVRLLAKEPKASDFKSLSTGVTRVPLPPDSWQDPAAVQEILDDARGYDEKDLHAADMNNLACANMWIRTPAKVTARAWLAKAQKKATDPAEIAVIGHNADLLAEMPSPLDVPLPRLLTLVGPEKWRDIVKGDIATVSYKDAS